MKVITAVTALAVFVLSAQAFADGRIDRIRESGSITLGYPESSVPFGYLDGQQKPVGYTVEICEAVAAKIKAALGLKALEVHYNPTASATRRTSPS